MPTTEDHAREREPGPQNIRRPLLPGQWSLPGRAWVLALAVTAIGLLLLLSVGLLTAQRQASLDRAHARTQREVQRLAAELDQSLRLAQASIGIHAAAPSAGDNRLTQGPLVRSLNLPFDLRLLRPGPQASPAPVEQWLPDLPRREAGQWLLPLRWQQPPEQGGHLYEVLLSRDALLTRFASEAMPAGSSMSLFRLEEDGATTVLARHPLVENEQGRTIRGHLASAVSQQPAGVFEATATIDGIHRIIGYQRLGGPADRLMIVYALGTQGVLATWNSLLPWAVALTLGVAAAIALGAWRLDRSIRALRDSQQLFETLFQSAPEAMSLSDWHTGQLLLVNDAFCQLFGRPRDTLLGQSSLALGLWPAPHDRQQVLQALASGASVREVAARGLRPNGEPVHVRYSAERVQVDGQDRLLLMFRDVTQLEQEQQAAAREQERLSRFVLMLFRLASRFINLPVQQMHDAVDDALGDVGRFVRAGRAYIFTYDLATGTTSNTHEWCADGVSAEIGNLQRQPLTLVPDWVQAHLNGQRVQIDDVARLPAGPLREMLERQHVRSLTTLPLMLGQTCLGFVGLDWVDDVHQWVDEDMALLDLFAQMLVNTQMRTQTEGRLHELTEQLEQKVAERTAQLEMSVQRLQMVNRELETFTYSASHDLRTPLRGIEGFSALLLQDHAVKLDPQGREYLQRIQRATLHMSQLITDLLAYSRLEQVTDHVGPVDLLDLVQEVAQPFMASIERRQGQLHWRIAPRLKVLADPRGLSLVLRNLLDNALKFTPAERRPDILIRADQDGDQVHLSVTDNGQGFDMGHHDRIFGMFQRLHRQDQVPGTGIGLALVAKAIERMGGHIRADSVPGQGSTFHIHVPGAAT